MPTQGASPGTRILHKMRTTAGPHFSNLRSGPWVQRHREVKGTKVQRDFIIVTIGLLSSVAASGRPSWILPDPSGTFRETMPTRNTFGNESLFHYTGVSWNQCLCICSYSYTLTYLSDYLSLSRLGMPATPCSESTATPA